MQLQTGSAREVITPPVGIPLGGNARTNNYATHVLHQLYIRALYVENGGDVACVISVDTLGLREQDARNLRRQVAETLGLHESNVLVACTHTHSGPDTLRLFCPTAEKLNHDRDQIEPWMNLLFDSAGAAALKAKSRAVPSRMKLGQINNAELPYNRRLKLESGATAMNWTLPSPETVVAPLGPIDPTATLASFYAENGSLTGAIVHYTLHPAILAGQNLGISGDYCGVAMDLLEKEFAPAGDAAFLFLNGALGNINHINYKQPAGRDADEVNRCGSYLAASVRELISRDHPSEDAANSSVNSLADDLLFPIREIPEAQLVEAREVLARDADGEMAAADGVPPEMEARRTLILHAVQSTGSCPDEFTTLRDGKIVVPLQVIKIGRLILSGVPGEMFVEHGLQLKDLTNNPYALLVCPANGYIGYIPTEEAFDQGGYEPALGPSYLEPGAGDTILNHFIKMQSSIERNRNEAEACH